MHPGRADSAPRSDEETPSRGAAVARHDFVIDIVGQEICSETLEAGRVITGDWLEERFSVSRSVVREVVRVLETLGMAESRRRVGVTILPRHRWNLFDPRVIRWQLAGANRIPQLRALTELRSAIEPTAARLAAEHATPQQASELVALGARLFASGKEGDSESFLELDKHFHGMVLELSGNEMFAQLHGLIDEVLIGRTHYGLMPRYPHPEALDLHLGLASAIQQGRPEEASATALAIMQRTLAEMATIWETGEAPTTE